MCLVKFRRALRDRVRVDFMCMIIWNIHPDISRSRTPPRKQEVVPDIFRITIFISFLLVYFYEPE